MAFLDTARLRPARVSPLRAPKRAQGREGPVRFIAKTTDRKLAPSELRAKKHGGGRPSPIALGPFASSTYASIEATCPSSCRFKKAGCYVRSGFTSGMARQLDDDARGLSGDAVAIIEAEHIKAAFDRGPIPQDGARGGRDLRLHAGGDVPSEAGARYLAEAAADWVARGGGRVWTYTHRWREIPREAFGGVHVLASVESIVDAKLALARGYAPALVVRRHWDDNAEVVEGMRIVPCPAETRGATCVSCRLCLNATGLAERNTAVAFALHGRDQKRVRLPVYRGAAEP